MKLLIIKHYGVKGMKWGVRKDSYYTPKGRKKSARYKGVGSFLLDMLIGPIPSYAKELSYASDIKKLEDLPKKTREYSDDEDMALINPKYNPKDLKTNANCVLCTAAYGLRKRGYDVTANFHEEGMSEKQILDFYKNADNSKNSMRKTKDYIDKEELKKLQDQLKNTKYSFVLKNFSDEYHNIDNKIKKLYTDAYEKELLSYGNGAFGEFGIFTRNGFGHSVAFEVKNNKVIIRDCQVNKKYSLSEFIDSFDYQYKKQSTNTLNSLLYDHTNILRTDNLELSPKILRTVRRIK